MEEFYKALPYPFAHSIFSIRPSDVLQSRGVRSQIIYPISLFLSGILPHSLLDVYGFEDYRPVILEKFFCLGLSTDSWWFCPVVPVGLEYHRSEAVFFALHRPRWHMVPTWPGACGADFAHLVRVGSVSSSAVRSSPFLLERYSETLRKPIPLTVALQCPPPPMFSCLD